MFSIAKCVVVSSRQRECEQGGHLATGVGVHPFTGAGEEKAANGKCRDDTESEGCAAVGQR